MRVRGDVGKRLDTAHGALGSNDLVRGDCTSCKHVSWSWNYACSAERFFAIVFVEGEAPASNFWATTAELNA